MPLGGKQNDTVLGARYLGPVLGVLQYLKKKGEIMVARYSGEHGIRGPVLEGFTVFKNLKSGII